LKKQIRKVPHWFATVLLLLLLCGCGPRAHINGTVAVTAMNIPLSDSPNWNAVITCTRGKHQITQSLSLCDTNLETEVIIPVGTWNISLQLTDEAGNVVYQDQVTGVAIYPHTPTVIDFQLRPVHGTVKVIVDLEGHPHADQIMRARVHFNNQYKEIIRSSVDEFIEGEYEIAAGSYDFNVELYTESFRVSDKIDLGMWATIDVEPLSEQTVIWRPHLELLTIAAQIYLLPDTPKHVSGQFWQQQTVLTWDPSPAVDLEGYHIYWQPSPWQRYSLIATVDRNTTTYTHDLSELEELPSQAYYAVAPFSAALEGYRSPPILIPFL